MGGGSLRPAGPGAALRGQPAGHAAGRRLPDGRYLLLKQELGVYKVDYRAIPILLDRESGTLTEGAVVAMRTAVWSGEGFWIDHFVHLNLDLTASRHDALADALGETEERQITDSSVAPGAGRICALTGPGSWPDPVRLDLACADLDGSHPMRLPDFLETRQAQLGPVAGLSLSPDGRYAAVMGWEPVALLVDLSAPGEQPLAIPIPEGPRLIDVLLWSPDSAHLLVGGLGVVALEGNLLLPYAGWAAAWTPDGTGLVLPGREGAEWVMAYLDGRREAFTAPEGRSVSVLRQPLQDGRLVMTYFDPGRP